jgi:rubredoxin
MESRAIGSKAGRTPIARFRCVGCSYGASRSAAPERCPICGGTVWEYESRRPFPSADTTRSKTAERDKPAHALSASTDTPRGSSFETYRQAIEALQPDDVVQLCVALYARVEQLETALQSRIVIEQAKGVLAERMQLQPEEAFQLLRLAARSERRKLHAVAKQVVEEATTPQAIIRTMAREQRWRALVLAERNEAVRERRSKVEDAQKRQADRRTRTAQD